KVVDASQPAFKPRNVKKTQDSRYRDRAAERRTGDGNDYAHVEAVLEDFEKRNADQDREKIEAQRKYLGGDSEHSILVKGLDFALLEQNKARSTITTEDLDALDQAFHESSTAHDDAKTDSTVPRKRTRDELLQELKAQRAGKAPKSAMTVEEEARALEEAKQKGKFKPIGFKPIGQSEGKKKKSKADSTDPDKKKKKKRKVEADGNDNAKSTTNDSGPMPPPSPIPNQTSGSMPPPPPPDEPIDEEFDIFADAGEYKGIDTEEEEDEGSGSKPKSPARMDAEDTADAPSSSVPRRWIDTEEDDRAAASTTPSIPLPSSQTSAAPSTSKPSPPPHPHREARVSDDEDMEEDDKPVRLVPLESSALPSIKDLLAMDKAAGSYDKRKKRKDKKKNAGGGDDDDDDAASKKKSLDAKVDRDYKRLKNYTDKKAASGSK
ncbi:hypothetical protein CPC08DRAFT_633203, partial [Agrocybe pediades]